MPAELNQAQVIWGITPGSRARMRDQVGRFMKTGEYATQATEMQMGLLAAEMDVAIRAAWERHNRTGQTISTLRIDVAGLVCKITINGGFVFVEYGAKRHPITARNGGVLAFMSSSGEQLFRKSVVHPGITRDPVLEEAEAMVDFPRKLRQIAYLTFDRIEGKAMKTLYGAQTGEVYPATT